MVEAHSAGDSRRSPTCCVDQLGVDHLCVLTALTGSHVYYILPLCLLPQVTRDRHGHQLYSGHGPHYLTSSVGTTQQLPPTGHHIHGAYFTTGPHTLVIPQSTMKHLSTTLQGRSRLNRAPCSNKSFSTPSTTTINRPDQQAHIAVLTFASILYGQTDHSDISHLGFEEGDHHRPVHFEGLPEQKTRQLCSADC
jgi:hypothetical protein